MIEQAASPFKIGDTVRIVGPMYTGQVGELVVIDPENIESCDFFCVYLDSVEKVVPFAADELERVENVDMVILQSEEGRKLSIRLSAFAKAGYRDMARPYQQKFVKGGLTRHEANEAWKLVREFGY